MEAFLRLTKGFVLWAAIIGLMAASVATALAAMALWVVSSLWEPAGIDKWAVLGLVFLNGGNVLFVATTAFAASDRTILNSADSFWPQVPSYTALGVGLMFNSLFVCAIILDPALLDRQWIWLFMFAVTSILLCASSAFTAAIFPHIAEANRWLPFSFYFVHINATAHVVIMLIAIATVIEIINGLKFSDDIAILIPTIWVKLTAIAAVLVLLNWHKPRAIFTLLVAVILAIIFGGACFYASPFYAGGQYSGTSYPVVLTAVPLLVFLVILLRRKVRL